MQLENQFKNRNDGFSIEINTLRGTTISLENENKDLKIKLREYANFQALLEKER